MILTKKLRKVKEKGLAFLIIGILILFLKIALYHRKTEKKR